jgi:hypothetical protein
MTALQAIVVVYLAVGLIRSAFMTTYFHSLVEEPAGGIPRIVGVYLLLVVMWGPLDACLWVIARLSC